MGEGRDGVHTLAGVGGGGGGGGGTRVGLKPGE